MTRIHQKAGGLLLAGLLAVGVSLTQPANALATCFGTRYDYFSSPSFQEQVGSKISCPGHPDQYDLDIYGNANVTPWYTSYPVTCPCPGSGGGGGGGRDWEEMGPFG